MVPFTAILTKVNRSLTATKHIISVDRCYLVLVILKDLSITRGVTRPTCYVTGYLRLTCVVISYYMDWTQTTNCIKLNSHFLISGPQTSFNSLIYIMSVKTMPEKRSSKMKPIREFEDKQQFELSPFWIEIKCPYKERAELLSTPWFVSLSRTWCICCRSSLLPSSFGESINTFILGLEIWAYGGKSSAQLNCCLER